MKNNTFQQLGRYRLVSRYSSMANSGSSLRGGKHSNMDSTLFRLIHYSSKLMERLNNCTYIQRTDWKPSGLWLSVEGFAGDLNWKDWCLSEGFRLEELAFSYEVKLKKEADILHLYDKPDLIYFTKEFGIDNNKNIDWSKVNTFYRGIIIAPYIWTARLDPECFWYYGYDCACACVWSLSAIESFKPLPIVLQKTPDLYT